MRAICFAILAYFAYKMSSYIKPYAARGALLLTSIALAVTALVLCIIGL
mgnify:CR=1 FL=1